MLPNPETATPGVLHAAELPAFLDVAASLDPLHAELGDASNEAYTSDPRWNRVVGPGRFKPCDAWTGVLPLPDSEGVSGLSWPGPLLRRRMGE